MTSELRKVALSLPDTEEGISCEGTALEKQTIKVRKKAFVFLGKSDVMLKLGDSLSEATAFAQEKPDQVKVGANGWVTVKFAAPKPISIKTVQKWVAESYSLMASKPVRKRR